MDNCCTPSTRDEADAKPGRCVECAAVGRTVELITLKALLRSSALERLTAGEYSFCGTPSCAVVYFREGASFRHDEVAVPVFQKANAGSRIVCYCLGISEDQIRREVEDGGASAIVQRIKALIAAGSCACEVRNPEGRCCLGHVLAL